MCGVAAVQQFGPADATASHNASGRGPEPRPRGCALHPQILPPLTLLCSGYLAVPLAEYAANIKAIASKLRAAGASVLIVTPPPVNDAGGRFADGARSNARAGAYAAAALGVARDMGLPAVDLHSAIQVPRLHSCGRAGSTRRRLRPGHAPVLASLHLTGSPITPLTPRSSGCVCFPHTTPSPHPRLPTTMRRRSPSGARA